MKTSRPNMPGFGSDVDGFYGANNLVLIDATYGAQPGILRKKCT